MKKFALISAILFFVVYFWANIVVSDDEPTFGAYPVVAANPSTEAESVDEALLERIMEAEAPAEVEGGYYLIVGSFSDIDQARQAAEKYKNDYEAEMIVLPPTPQGYYRLSYGRYSSPEEAGATLPAVREKVNSDAWIYQLR